MRGWFCPSTNSSHGTIMSHRVQGDDEVQPMQVLQRHNTDHFPPHPRPPPKFKLQLPKTTSQTKRGDEVAGVFFFYFSFRFLFFGAVAFHCQCLKDFSLCVKKNTTKTKTWILKSIHVSPLWKHYTACGCTAAKRRTLCAKFYWFEPSCQTPSSPCNTP